MIAYVVEIGLLAYFIRGAGRIRLGISFRAIFVSFLQCADLHIQRSSYGQCNLHCVDTMYTFGSTAFSRQVCLAFGKFALLSASPASCFQNSKIFRRSNFSYCQMTSNQCGLRLATNSTSLCGVQTRG